MITDIELAFWGLGAILIVACLITNYFTVKPLERLYRVRLLRTMLIFIAIGYIVVKLYMAPS